jgi:hypothetical protein
MLKGPEIAAVLIIGLAMLGACSLGTASVPKDKREALDQITAKCNLQSSIFTLGEGDNIIFRPPADANYDDVDCALTEVKKSPFSFKLGFVGNEALAPEKQK